MEHDQPLSAMELVELGEFLKPWPRYHDLTLRLVCHLGRLIVGQFTEEELKNLCHNLDPDMYKAFCDGCTEYQRRLFGHSREDDLKEVLHKGS